MIAPPVFQLHQGSGRLIVSVPHAGTYLPPDIATHLTPLGQAVVDTDWYVDRLYEFVKTTDASMIVATHSRIVVDLNRGPEGGKLYPGQAETGICPTESFAGETLYRAAPPDEAAIARRVAVYWHPYHAALRTELDRKRAQHGAAHLLDAHSIRSAIPRLFPGTLPDLNFGTNDGASATATLTNKVVAAANSTFTCVLNGRFKGGYITRHYGSPAQGVQAIQLELAQTTYMNETRPDGFAAAQAAPLISVLKQVVAACA